MATPMPLRPLVLSGDLRRCDLCNAEVDKVQLVYSYKINVHAMDRESGWDQEERFCSACAEGEAKQRSYGEPELAYLPSLEANAEWLFGEPVAVRWIQGDEHVILIHIRRV